MKIFYTLCLGILIGFNANSQITIEWQNTIGGDATDGYVKLQQTLDGGYILGGVSTSNISGDKTENCFSSWEDYWIVKIDDVGNVEWDNTIGGDDIDILTSIQQTNDGGYILGGYTMSMISGDKTDLGFGGYDLWIVKLNGFGIIEWQRTIGGNENDLFLDLKQCIDGNFILGASSESNISGDKSENCFGGYDYWIIKIDTIGNLMWQKTIGGNDADMIYSLTETNDGGFILGGTSGSNISGNKTDSSNGFNDYWIVKVDSLGNIQWQNSIGGSNLDYLNSIQQTDDGGYILGGESMSDISGDKTEINRGDWDYWVVRTDSSGIILWQRTLGGSELDLLSVAREQNDGGFIIGGTSNSDVSGDKSVSSIGGLDFWIIRLDSTGNLI